MLNETVIFRATDELATAIQHKAKDAGLTVSEYLREIIASSVGVHEVVSPVCFNLAEAAFFTGDNCAYHSAVIGAPLRPDLPYPDPMALLPAAGAGDEEAQRELADMAIALALSDQPDVDPFSALSEGLVFARLADRYDEIDDAMRIIRMLALSSTLATGEAARHLAAEAIARLELLDCGSLDVGERVADLLATSMEHEQPVTIQLAKDYRDRLSNARRDRHATDDAT